MMKHKEAIRTTAIVTAVMFAAAYVVAYLDCGPVVGDPGGCDFENFSWFAFLRDGAVWTITASLLLLLARSMGNKNNEQ